MNVWLFAMGIGTIVLGIFILNNRERFLRWSLSNSRQNVGQLGERIFDAAKPSHMIVPAIVTILIGVSYLIQALTQAPATEVTRGSSYSA
ncbi:MAG: hypothetical protein ABWY57_14570, partial [Mycetocola sp.]